MNISLPAPLKAFVEGQLAEGRYSSASEYVRDLIRADEKAKALAKLEALLLEGLASEKLPWTPETMDEIRRDARQRH